MRLGRVQFTIRSLMSVVAVAAVLLGGAILLLRELAPTRPTTSPRPKKTRVIMEGVDFNTKRGPVAPYGPTRGGR